MVDIKALTLKLQKVVAACVSEEDLRVNMELVLRDAIPGLPTPQYEKSVRTSTFRGRADAVHRGLIIEYEKPDSMRAPNKYDHAIQQACDYLTGFALGQTGKHEMAGQPNLFPQEVTYSRDQEERLSANVGLATDGERFVFIQRRGRKWHPEPRRLDEDTVEKLLLWLRAMNRKDLSPEHLLQDFGPETRLAKRVVGVLVQLVDSGEYPKANVIYEEWKRIFGIVYGVEQLHRPGRAPEAKALATAYQLRLGVSFPVLLFALHTYYALLMKLLATEVIVAQGAIGDTFVGSLARTSLRQQLTELESGEILQRHNVRNAIEQDFFGWYTEAWTDELHDVLWSFCETLGTYDIGTFEIKPDRARDLLKDLYHGLIPESVRHALGEYYTPDWLAEHTIELSGYDGDPQKSFLDASCGSGTFLVVAIHKIRQWLSDRSVEWGSNNKKLDAVTLIRRNVVGFDLNPLAVIASRTNYLFALGPLLRYRSGGSDFEIPVYLTDSVLLPGRTPAQKKLFGQDTVAFPMTVGTFDLPVEVVDKRQVPELMNALHEAITDGHSRDAFVNRAIKQLGLSKSGSTRAALWNLFDTMHDLDRQGKNRIWAKLIRNRYASLFFKHHFDFVVGNPPHVNWESLTPDWRDAAQQHYVDYGLFTLSGLDSQHGGGKKDIAALFTYAVLDHFLKPGGVLALIVHVSLFKTSGAGEGYRRFQLGTEEHFCIQAAHDFKSFQPFQTHPAMKIKTRTLTFRAVKGKPTVYPVPYFVWTKTEKGIIPGYFSWNEAATRLASEKMSATPLRGTSKAGRLSPWLTVPEKKLAECSKIIAPTDYQPQYQGHAGIYTGGLNGAYFIEIEKRFPDGTLQIKNMHDVGKIECPLVRATMETDLVYPLLRGRNVAKWSAEPMCHVVIVQDSTTQRGYPEKWLQETHPLAWKYLKKFEKALRKRKAFQKFFDPERDPFYSMYSITKSTFEPHKVIWMDISATVKAAVLSGRAGNSMILPEHTVMFLTTRTEDEAHYVAAVLNSSPVNTIVSGYIVDNHLSTHPIENIVIPKYDAKDRVHQQLASLSREAHAATRKLDAKQLAKIEGALNETVWKIW